MKGVRFTGVLCPGGVGWAPLEGYHIRSHLLNCHPHWGGGLSSTSEHDIEIFVPW